MASRLPIPEPILLPVSISEQPGKPLYLTRLYAHDASDHQQMLSIKSINDALISVPYPYTLEGAKWFLSKAIPQLPPFISLPLQAIRLGDPVHGRVIGNTALNLKPRPATPGSHSYGIRNPADYEMIENEDSESDIANEHFELGYYLHPEFRGSGIMVIAVKALLGYAREIGVKCVSVVVADENKASARVVEQVGEFGDVEEGEGLKVQWPESKGGLTKICRRRWWKG